MSQAIRRFSLGRVNERQRHGVELVTQILEDYEDVAGGTALEFLLTDLMHSCNARQAPLRPWP